MSTPVSVTLVFEGVLVGRYDKENRVYEMGVLPVPSHSFSIAIEEHGLLNAAGDEPLITTDPIAFNETEISPDDSRWRLEVPGSAPSASVFLADEAPPDRQTLPPDDESGKQDYRWVIHLDKDLPNHLPDGVTALPRHDGLLKPMLQITRGEFYARKIFRGFLSTRQGGKGAHQDFGFVPQQVAADFTIEAGEQVVLKKVVSNGDVFRLTAHEGRSYTIFFRNTPPDDAGLASATRAEDELPKADVNRPSHFQLLYLLFNVPPDKRYEFRALPTTAVPRPNIRALAIAAEFMAAPRRSLGVGVPTPRCAPVDGGG